MIGKTRWAFALLAFLMATAPATALEQKSYTVQELRNFCRGSGEGLAYCLGFIGGTAAVMFMNGDAGSAGLWTACGEDPPFDAMRQAFLNWADKHPEHWGIEALAGVGIAIKATWPCPPR